MRLLERGTWERDRVGRQRNYIAILFITVVPEVK
jgi:hypothetical protein